MSAKYNKILLIILFVGLLLRIIGITYGLPLWLVGDEPPFVLSALKMIELKTLVPALHASEFEKISYFPPYLAYLYIPPFVAILVVKFLSFAGHYAQFAQYLLLDLSVFFITARIISALAGILTVWLLYRIAMNLFHEHYVALLSAGFLSFSTMHVLLSHWGRDWIYIVLLLVMALYTMSNPIWNEKKRYYYTSIIAGAAFGFSAAAIFIPIYMALYALSIEHKNIFEIIKNKIIWISAAIFAGLALFSYVLFPAGFFFAKTNSLATPKTLWYLLETYRAFIQPIAFNDAVLFFWAIVGFVILFFSKSRIFWTFVLFMNIYILSFFVTFHTGDRFAIFLYPFLALSAGYGIYWLFEHVHKSKNILIALVAVSFVLMLAQATQVDRILIRNDTRIQAKKWIEFNVPSKTKIITMAPLMRLSTTPEAISEQEQIQSSSLRSIDRSERALSNFVSYPLFHSLNLYSVNGGAVTFYNKIETYISKNNYQFELVSTSGFDRDIVKTSALQRLQTLGIAVKTFRGVDQFGYDLTEGTIGNLKNLFTMNANGPTIHILKYK